MNPLKFNFATSHRRGCWKMKIVEEGEFKEFYRSSDGDKLR
jgi:hypothetical protein